MIEFRDSFMKIGANFIAYVIEPIQVLGLVMAVGAILYCAIKLILSKKAEERTSIIENIGFIPIGIFFIGSAFSILGYIFNSLIL